MKTGNTGQQLVDGAEPVVASMEPGHEDREYSAGDGGGKAVFSASMEPGHEDREYLGILYRLVTMAMASMEPGHEDREYACR